MADIMKNYSIMPLPMSIERGFPIPLDSSSIYYSYEELAAYAASNPVAYVGQQLTLVDEVEGAVKVYVIVNAEGALEEVGAGLNFVVDNNSLVLDAEAETLEMYGFGKQYYKFVPAAEEGGQPTYELVTVDETNSWKAGLELKTVLENGKVVLGWFEPNATTVEGLNSQIGSLQTSVDSLSGTVDGLSATVAEQGTAIEEVETKVAQLTGAFIFRGAKDTYEELPTNAAAGDVWQVAEKEYVWTGSEWIEFGYTTNVDLTDYVTNAKLTETLEPVNTSIAGLTDRAGTLEGYFAEGGRVTLLETAHAELETSVGTLEAGLEAVAGRVDTLETSVGSLDERLQAVEAWELGDKNVINSLSVDGVALIPQDKNVALPIFAGDAAGLVPNAEAEDLTANHFLNANGVWALPMDERIGTLTYAETAHSNVESYVLAVAEAIASEHDLVWEEIS